MTAIEPPNVFQSAEGRSLAAFRIPLHGTARKRSAVHSLSKTLGRRILRCLTGSLLSHPGHVQLVHGRWRNFIISNGLDIGIILTNIGTIHP